MDSDNQSRVHPTEPRSKAASELSNLERLFAALELEQAEEQRKSCLSMPEAFITLKMNGKIIEAECSLCRDVIYKPSQNSRIEAQHKELREAAHRHCSLRHSELQCE
jgi:hypothetical protein